ncbi:MAG: SDR family oxidoreductase [Mixta calida]|uniref:SDR family oxidoreductase n=1 Tax=Mixta calida TaxID=665913 RepID=UPI00290E4545|nr:SDR family oxidoreductase [Mixta calida]MDU4940603.1 SDR family oxidoreductase [Mixta calida]
MILNAFNLEGKVALITGCNTGLGQGMAVGLAQAGCDIVGVNHSGADDTPGLVEATGRRFVNINADLMDSSCIPQVVEQAVAAFGRIDILVNNAGIIRRQDAIEFSEKDWDDVMNINSKTVFFMSQAVARQFIKQGNGGASKSAVMGLTRLMANEWAAHNINVNAIAPGYMATNNTEQLRNDEGRSQEILGRIPAGRWGKPDDMMGPVVFLASSASDYVNGYTLAVDGGWLAR